MMQIPLQAIPVQTVSVALDGQSVQISLRQQPNGLFVDVTSDGVNINFNVLALNRNPLIRQPYRGFSGQLMFRDVQGNSDPDYTGLASRFELIYLTEAEYAQL